LLVTRSAAFHRERRSWRGGCVVADLIPVRGGPGPIRTSLGTSTPSATPCHLAVVGSTKLGAKSKTWLNAAPPNMEMSKSDGRRALASGSHAGFAEPHHAAFISNNATSRGGNYGNARSHLEPRYLALLSGVGGARNVGRAECSGLANALALRWEVRGARHLLPRSLRHLRQATSVAGTGAPIGRLDGERAR
jgi:hypothetical protein